MPKRQYILKPSLFRILGRASTGEVVLEDLELINAGHPAIRCRTRVDFRSRLNLRKGNVVSGAIDNNQGYWGTFLFREELENA